MNLDVQRHHSSARMSKIVRYGGLVFLCGQTASGSIHANGDIESQTAEVLTRVDILLNEIGSDRSRILSATIYLRNMKDFSVMNSVWEAWMPSGNAPARTTVEAHLASESLLIEVTVIAASIA